MSKYSDGEFQPSYEESIRGIWLIVCSISQFNRQNLLLMIDAEVTEAATTYYW
jgi:ribose-phosphate pyrophosphokinase